MLTTQYSLLYQTAAAGGATSGDLTAASGSVVNWVGAALVSASLAVASPSTVSWVSTATKVSDLASQSGSVANWTGSSSSNYAWSSVGQGQAGWTSTATKIADLASQSASVASWVGSGAVPRQGMVEFAANSSAFVNGQAINQTTQRWNTTAQGGVTYNEFLSGGIEGIVRATNTTALRRLLSLDAVPSTAANIDMISKFRFASLAANSTLLGLGARCSGTSGTSGQYGYTAIIGTDAGNATVLRIRKYDGTTGTVQLNTDFATAISAATLFWMRFQVTGTTSVDLKMKVWADGAAEPAGWDVEVTDSTPETQLQGGGWAGFFNFKEINLDCANIAWATDGATPPPVSTKTYELFDTATSFQPVYWRTAWANNPSTECTYTEDPGGYLRITGLTQDRHAIFMDSMATQVAVGNAADVEILFKARADTRVNSQPSIMAVLRGSGATAATANAYRMTLNDVGGGTSWTLNVGKYLAGTASNLGSPTTVAFNLNEWWWFRLRANGIGGTVTVTAKAWKDGTSESTAVTASATDSTSPIVLLGFNGVQNFLIGNMDVDSFSYALGGGVAPNPYEGALASASGSVATWVGSAGTLGSGDLSSTGQATAAWVGAATTSQPWTTASQSVAAWNTTAFKSSNLNTAAGSIANWVGVIGTPWSAVGQAQAGWNSTAFKSSILNISAPATASWVGVSGSVLTATSASVAAWNSTAFKLSDLNAQSASQASWVGVGTGTVNVWNAASASSAAWVASAPLIGSVYFNANTQGNLDERYVSGHWIPQQTTRRWGATTGNSEITEFLSGAGLAPNAVGVVRMTNTSGTGRRALSLDGIPSGSANIELLGRMRSSGLSTNTSNFGLLAKGTGAVATEEGYAAIFYTDVSGTPFIRFTRYDGGAFTNPVGDAAYPQWSANNWHWMRFRVIGADISIRVWPDGTVEPTAWDITYTDPSPANITSTGCWHGPFFFAGGINVDYDYVGWALNGATAPGPSNDYADYFSRATSIQPQNWRRAWVLSNSSVSENVAGFARLNASVDGRHALMWDQIPAGNRDVEELLKVRFDTVPAAGQPAVMVMMRASGQAGNEQAYRAGVWEVNGSWYIAIGKYDNGVASSVVQTDYAAFSLNNWYWIRYRVKGTDPVIVSFKIWKDGEAEETGTFISWRDSGAPILPPGWTGLVGFSTGNLDVDYASYAVGSDVTNALLGTKVAPSPGVATLSTGVPTLPSMASSAAWVATSSGLAANQGIFTASAKRPSVRWVSGRKPQLGTYYVTQNNVNVSVQNAFLGYTIPLAMDFAAFDTKSNWTGSVNSISGFWAGKGYRLYISIGLATSVLPQEVSCLGIAAGSFNTELDAMATKLVNDGHAYALVRFGWEPNGGWFPWGTDWGGSYTARAADYVAAFKQAVRRFRIAGDIAANALNSGDTQHFEFVWAANITYGQDITENYYPADIVSPAESFVDWVAPDGYMQQYNHNNMTPQDIWDREMMGWVGTPITNYTQYGFAWFLNWAQTKGKKFGLAEIGLPFKPDGHGAGDQDIWWRNVNELLTKYGPPEGALLGVFDIDPADAYSSFTSSPNVPTATTDYWYQLKYRSAWSFRKYFGDPTAVSELSQADFEIVAPSGVHARPRIGFGTQDNIVIPLGTPGGVTAADVTVATGTRVWSLDAGDSSGSANSPAGIGNGPLSVSLGFLGGSPLGGQLQVRGNKSDTPMSGNQIIGARNGLGGVNVNVTVSVAAVAGVAKGWDFFENGTGGGPDGWTVRWGTSNPTNGQSSISWLEQAAAPGYVRATTKQVSQRHSLWLTEAGSWADIDVACAIRMPVLPSIASATFGGVLVRASGALGNETGYMARLITNASSAVQLVITRYLNGANVDIGTPFAYPAFTANTWHEIRLQVVGTTLKAKVWLATDPEPVGWGITTTDSGVTAAGTTGLFCFYWQSGDINYDFDYFGWDALNVGITSNPVPPDFGGELFVTANRRVSWVGDTAGVAIVGGAEYEMLGGSSVDWDSTAFASAPLSSQAGAVANWVGVADNPWSAVSQSQATWGGQAANAQPWSSQSASQAAWVGTYQISIRWDAASASQASWVGTFTTAGVTSADWASQSASQVSWTGASAITISGSWQPQSASQALWVGQALGTITAVWNAASRSVANWVGPPSVPSGGGGGKPGRPGDEDGRTPYARALHDEWRRRQEQIDRELHKIVPPVVEPVEPVTELPETALDLGRLLFPAMPVEESTSTPAPVETVEQEPADLEALAQYAHEQQEVQRQRKEREDRDILAILTMLL